MSVRRQLVFADHEEAIISKKLKPFQLRGFAIQGMGGGDGAGLVPGEDEAVGEIGGGS